MAHDERVVLSGRERWAAGLIYRSVRLASLPLFAAYFRLAVDGVENVPARGAFLLAGNHVSYLDPGVVGSACPRRLRFLMSARVMAFKGLEWFYRGMSAIPVDPTPRATREAFRLALECLGSGAGVCLFPEGGRAEPGRMDPGRLGVAFLARRSGVPVVPVGIAGTEISMPRGRALPEPTRVRVAFGAPLRHGAAGATSGAARAEDRAFTDGLMAAIKRLADEAGARR